MMNEQPDLSFPGGGESIDDERIRQLLISGHGSELPSGIETRVLSKVKRRRLVSRAVVGGIGVAAVVAVGLLSHRFLPNEAPTKLIADIADVEQPSIDALSDDGGFGFEQTHLIALAAASPVVEFQRLGRDQLAILESLKSWKEEL